MRADYHIHTEYSNDSTEKMERVVERAIDIGLDEICFTDHVDYGVKFDHSEANESGQMLNVDYISYFREIEKFRRKYAGQIAIKQGLEFGVQAHTVDKFQKIFDTYDLDFVILSCHQVDDKEFWTKDFQAGKTVAEYNAEYYREIYECMQLYKNYSVLGHLDMLQRYNEWHYPFEKSEEIITRILGRAIADGKGIEVNTSSFKYGLDDLTPSRDILTLYHNLGGKIISIGSDCHSAEYLDDHIDYVRRELRKIGFTEFCTFDKMRPVFHEL